MDLGRSMIVKPDRLAQFAAQKEKDHPPEWSSCSVSLTNIGRGERIRTSDLTVPNRALYQAEPRPDNQLKAFGY